MPRPNRSSELTQFLQQEGRVARRAELVTRFGRAALARAEALSLVTEVLPGVLTHTANAKDFSTRVRAVQAWMPPQCAVTGLAALRLRELTELDPPRIAVLAPRHLHVRGPEWVRIRRTDVIGPMTRWRGIRCVARERALIDAWEEAPRRSRVSTVLEAMRRSDLSGAAILEVVDRLPRVIGRRALVLVLREAMDGIESYLEHRARRTILNTPDFRDLLRQVEVFALGRRYVLDTYHEATRTVIEFDGGRIHGTRLRKRSDNNRDSALATLGMLTLRIGYDDVMTRPAWCRDVIRRTIAARASGHHVSLSAP